VGLPSQIISPLVQTTSLLLPTSLLAPRNPRLPVPVEIRPHIGTALAANLANKSIFNIG
jgi:hypothetical protein